MKKNDLIKKLNEIKGNPEIVIYNGATNYCHSIDSKIEESLYVKYSEEHNFSQLQFEEMKDRNSFDPLPENVIAKLREKAKDMVKKSIWDEPNPYHKKEEYDSKYGKNQRKVVVLSLKRKGITSTDRLGSLEF